MKNVIRNLAISSLSSSFTLSVSFILLADNPNISIGLSKIFLIYLINIVSGVITNFIYDVADY